MCEGRLGYACGRTAIGCEVSRVARLYHRTILQLSRTNKSGVVGKAVCGVEFLETSAKVLLLQEFVPGHDLPEEFVLGRTRKAIADNVLYGVVADKMVRHTIHCDGNGLLDKAACFEVIGIHERANENLAQGFMFLSRDRHADRW